MNPAFRPVPPLSEAIKDTLAVKAESTPLRRLAIEHKVSLQRLEAISKLKAREHQMLKEGKPLQMKYATGMAQMLGVPENSESSVEAVVENVPSVKSPRFAIIPEGSHMTPEEAAKILGRPAPSKTIPSLSSTQAKSSSKDEPVVLQKAPETPQDKPSRWAFSFTDFGRHTPDNTSVLVRETDGALRGATREEARERRRRYQRY
ncbi:eukaryotic mitochondrial regulator protein-domain-containing protein [Piptocephalis cylindrospora]|uniref:Eukaryotic mitochondrial regulator protein-domain-containing protein n=1 Tax=Piptocephalis cylindrospora TaxID=1907219 RepID=A0A4P9Y4G4_9FUNG|nr:eukaryotic mitochondrial regulator protein-domain-containing protein [Piptocephalis cylindrospora]|eukprot:RKP13827.1 eukaryotic mitochondrial regulator protein-domain-containing protein [Piptocephalis cylindrospora]